MQYKLEDLIRNWDIVNIKDLTEEAERVKVYAEVIIGIDKKPWPMMLYLTK